mmetsp:Transcript_17286/g.37348  ORF Transcript_17286/g.37348 Transcript_17286/m.37348 type:complete len:269 (+) Transcript_17286:2045-2851(+)
MQLCLCHRAALVFVQVDAVRQVAIVEPIAANESVFGLVPHPAVDELVVGAAPLRALLKVGCCTRHLDRSRLCAPLASLVDHGWMVEESTKLSVLGRGLYRVCPDCSHQLADAVIVVRLGTFTLRRPHSEAGPVRAAKEGGTEKNVDLVDEQHTRYAALWRARLGLLADEECAHLLAHVTMLLGDQALAELLKGAVADAGFLHTQSLEERRKCNVVAARQVLAVADAVDVVAVQCEHRRCNGEDERLALARGHLGEVVGEFGTVTDGAE